MLHAIILVSYSILYILVKAAKVAGENYRKADELALKEWEHTLLQNTMGIELNELNKRLEQKEVSAMGFVLSLFLLHVYFYVGSRENRY